MLTHTLPLLLLLSAAPAPSRLMLMPLAAGEGVEEKTADAITDALAAELRRQPGLQVLTRKEVSAALSLERQKELMGCKTDSCVAELGGALDVDRMVTGNVARLGESWIVHLQLLDARQVGTLGQADRRLRRGSVDDVLDAIPAMVRELLPALALPPGARASTPPAPGPSTSGTAAAVAPPAAATPAKAPPQPWADEPLDPSKTTTGLELVTDGVGHYLAFVPFDTEAPLLSSSDGRTFYSQLVIGTGSQGHEQFDFFFWEPRGHQRGATFDFRNGAYTLTCGKKKITYSPVPKEKSSSLLKGARLLKERWHRAAYALARDDEGTYYFIDQPRNAEEDADLQHADLRLYIGNQGSMTAMESRLLVLDRESCLMATGEGKLRISNASQEAEWIQGQEHRKLKWLPLDSNRVLIYTSLGVYKGERLGTPCDSVF